MNQKGFANIVLIALVVVLAGAVGYLVLTKQFSAPTLPLPEEATTSVSVTPQPQPPPQEENNIPIPKSSVSVLSPNGGEVLTVGVTVTVRWSPVINAAGGDKNLNTVVRLRRFNAATGQELFPSLPISGTSEFALQSGETSAVWTVRGYSGTAKGDIITLTDANVKYKVSVEITTRVFERGTPDYVTDDSNGYFTIQRGDITWTYDEKKVSECIAKYQSLFPSEGIARGYIVVGFPSSISLVLAKEIIGSHRIIPQETGVGFHSNLYAEVPEGEEFLWSCRLKQDTRIQYSDPSPIVRTGV